MKILFYIFTFIALVLVLGLIHVETAGMQTFGYYTLLDYPFVFFDGKTFNAIISKGEIRDSGEIQAANLFITQLPEQYRLLERVGSGQGAGNGYSQIRIFPEELQNKIRTGPYNYQAQNGIIIGTPCNNRIAAELLGITDCETYFRPGDGMVKLIEAYGNIYLIVTGYSGDAVFMAAKRFMSLAYSRQLSGTEIWVSSETVDLPLRIGEPIAGPGEAIQRGKNVQQQEYTRQYTGEAIPIRYVRI